MMTGGGVIEAVRGQCRIYAAAAEPAESYYRGLELGKSGGDDAVGSIGEEEGLTLDVDVHVPSQTFCTTSGHGLRAREYRISCMHDLTRPDEARHLL
jgi:hypothetical protein